MKDYIIHGVNVGSELNQERLKGPSATKVTANSINDAIRKKVIQMMKVKGMPDRELPFFVKDNKKRYKDGELTIKLAKPKVISKDIKKEPKLTQTQFDFAVDKYIK